MDYTVEIAIRAQKRLSQKALFDVAAIGGCACGNLGGRHVETMLTVKASSLPQAAARGFRRITRRCPGEVGAVEAVTIAEADRRLRAPARRWQRR